MTSHTLVINDGSLAGLVATWSEARATTPRPLDDTSAGSVLRPSTLLWIPADDRPQRARRIASVRRQADLCGLNDPIERTTPLLAFHPDTPATRGHAPAMTEKLAAGARTTAMLAAAALEAASRGIETVIWPVHVGGDTDELMELCDRALLVSQIISMDVRRDGPGAARMGVRIQTPYADLTDAQVMDLALDADAPLGAAWWCLNDQPEPCGQCGQCLRWRRALAAVDPAQALKLEDLTRANSLQPCI